MPAPLPSATPTPATGRLLLGSHSAEVLNVRRHAMDRSALCSLEGRDERRSTPRGVSPAKPADYYSAADVPCSSRTAHTANRLMTSRMTCASNKSPKREKSPHFCSCLHRRRASLKRWSRVHRETVYPRSSRAALLPPNDSREAEGRGHGFTKLHRRRLILTEGLDFNVIPHGNLLGVHGQTEQRKIYRKEQIGFEVCSSRKSCQSRLSFKTASDDVTLLGVKLTDSRQKRDFQPMNSPAERSLLEPCPNRNPIARKIASDEVFVRLVAKFDAILESVINVGERVASKLLGLRRRIRMDGSLEPPVTRLAWTPTGPMTFHRWILVLLLCIMVLPPPSTAAPGLPWQAGEDNQAQPGFKYSYYETLPAKAEYESVIICLLAVSAFIGLIVWVLKSNFEERQQKRMRREASLRERTSSLGFLKT